MRLLFCVQGGDEEAISNAFLKGVPGDVAKFTIRRAIFLEFALGTVAVESQEADRRSLS